MSNNKLKAAKDTLKYFKEQQWMHEISDDFYYQSKQKEIDDENIRYWEEKVKEIESQGKAQ